MTLASLLFVEEDAELISVSDKSEGFDQINSRMSIKPPLIKIKPTNKVVNFKVLIANDEELQLTVMSHLFSSFKGSPSFIATKAKNGYEAFMKVKEALGYVPADYFDLIVMDLGMPIMDGYQAAQKINDLYNADPLFSVDEQVFIDK